MAKSNLELFESEWAILQVVWKLEPCSAPTVQEALRSEKGWAHTTVKTMMDRMVIKGLLKVEKIRHLHLYRSAITQSHAQNSEIMRAVKRAFDGALTPMMQFLLDSNKLSKDQLTELEAMIKSKKVKACPERSRGVKSKM